MLSIFKKKEVEKKITHFTDDAIIDVADMSGGEEKRFYHLCMGLVKFRLDSIDYAKGRFANLFDVSFYCGGLGSDGFEIVYKKNTDATVIFGLNGGVLGYTTMISGSHGIIGHVGGEMKEKEFTMKDLEEFIYKSMFKLFNDEDIEEITCQACRKRILREYKVTD